MAAAQLNLKMWRVATVVLLGVLCINVTPAWAQWPIDESVEEGDEVRAPFHGIFCARWDCEGLRHAILDRRRFLVPTSRASEVQACCKYS